MIAGETRLLLLCDRCRDLLRKPNQMWLGRGRPFDMRRGEYYLLDDHGDMWAVSLVRFFLRQAGEEVAATGRLNDRAIRRWRELTAKNRHSWEITDRAYTAMLSEGRASYDDGDPGTVKLVQDMIEKMRAEGE